MLLTQEIEIYVTPRTVAHYKEKGYIIPTKISEKSKKEVIDSKHPITVKIQDLPENSHAKIKYQCDSCKRTYTTVYADWNKITYKELGTFCKKCAAKIKLPKAMMDKYGHANSSQVPCIIEKKKETNFNKYGNEWSIASEVVHQKIIDIFIRKYKVDNPMKNKFIQQKTMNTNCVKYGGNSPLCSEIIREKSKITCLEKYGFDNAFKNKEIQEKARKTLYKNGNTPTSKAEHKMCLILQEMFGKENCYPAFPCKNLSLDCLVVIEGTKIDFEYDGYYWHKDKKQHDYARNVVLLNEGYKIIRIKGNNKDTMPSKNQIQKAVESIIKNKHHLVFIDMNN